MNRQEIEEYVLRMMQEYCPGKAIALLDRFIEDLHLDGDDFTEIALRLERDFKFRADRKVWATTYSVINVVDLVDLSTG
jgi:acyl carrier protein